jgi:hypothetical protein
MKKIIFICALLAQGMLASAQIYVDGIKLAPDNTGQYIEVDPKYRVDPADGKCTFIVDYGQPHAKESYVTDATNRRIDFHSLVDGLNIFYANGWEVAQVSATDRGRRFLLKRRF